MKIFSHQMGIAIISTVFLVLGLACGNPDLVTDTTLNETELSELNLNIQIALKEAQGEPRLFVNASFTMPRNRLILRLPESYLRKEYLYQRIENLRVNEPGRLFSHKDSEAVRILEFPVGEKVVLHYEYRPDDPVNYGVGKETFSAPIIRNDYFQFVGSMVFIYPAAFVGTLALRMQINWDVPKDFKIYNSFGAEQTKQDLTTDFDKVRDAFFVAGRNIRSYHKKVRNQPVWITFEGQWQSIADQDFIDVVTRLLEVQRAAFNDDNYPYFLVNFLAEETDCDDNVKFAGTAHPNSFRAIFPAGDKCTFMPEMRQLISHELMHMWIGKKIRVGEERGHIDGKWFTEGFTDYFGRLLAYRAGVISQDEFFSSLNRQLEKYYTSAERFVTLRGLVDRMYRRGMSNRILEEIPYQQGEIMAWRLNKRIKIATSFSKSLEDVVKEMVADAEKSGGYKKFTIREVSSYFDSYAPQAFQEEYSKIVRGGLFKAPDLAQCRQPLESFRTKFRRHPERVSDPIYYYGAFQRDCDRWLK